MVDIAAIENSMVVVDSWYPAHGKMPQKSGRKTISLDPHREVHNLLDEDWIAPDGCNRVLRVFFSRGDVADSRGGLKHEKKPSAQMCGSITLSSLTWEMKPLDV